MHYTIGQRKGLGIAAGKPLYVTRIDAPANRIVTGDHSRLFSRECIVGDVRWSAGDEIIHPVKAGVKIRLKHRAAPAEIRPLSPGRRCLLLFDEPQLSIAPGQAAVFYEGDIVLGGGIIQSGSSSYAH